MTGRVVDNIYLGIDLGGTNIRAVALVEAERAGYTAEGEVFDEAGIPHREMWKAVKQ